MLGRLAKLASRSAQLRSAVLEKKAGLLGLAGRAARKNPLMAGMLGLGTVAGGMETVGKYKQYKSGFDPAAQQVMLGQPPVPPGA